MLWASDVPCPRQPIGAHVATCRAVVARQYSDEGFVQRQAEADGNTTRQGETSQGPVTLGTDNDWLHAIGPIVKRSRRHVRAHLGPLY